MPRAPVREQPAHTLLERGALAQAAAQARALSTTPRLLVDAPSRPPPERRPGEARTVTTIADTLGEWKGTRTSRTAHCLWKAVVVNACDAKAGAGHAQRITNVIDKLAFEETSAGFMPPARKTTAAAEVSVDMALLVHELDGLRSLLAHNPLARLSWAMDTTPALGREIAASSVTASELTWDESLQADGLPAASIKVHRITLPVMCATAKDGRENTLLLARAMQLVGTPWDTLLSPGFKWVDDGDAPLDNAAIAMTAERSTFLTGDAGGNLNVRDGPMDALFPEDSMFHHCDAHCGSLSSARARSVADMSKKIKSSAKYLCHGDNTERVLVHVRILLGFDPIPDGMDAIYEPRCAEAQRERIALMPGDVAGPVAQSELARRFSQSSSLRWEYHYVSNAQFWALRFVLPSAIYLEWGLGLDEYDWKQHKVYVLPTHHPPPPPRTSLSSSHLQPRDRYEIFCILNDPVNQLYMAMMRVDELIAYGSLFSVAQMNNDSSASHLAGPEAVWSSYRASYQELVWYPRLPLWKPVAHFWLHGDVADGLVEEITFKRVALPRIHRTSSHSPELSKPMRGLWNAAQPSIALHETTNGVYGLSHAQVIITLTRFVEERLASLDDYFVTSSFSSLELVHAMMHEEHAPIMAHGRVVGRSDYTIPSSRAVHAARELLRRRDDKHWSQRRGEMACSIRAPRTWCSRQASDCAIEVDYEACAAVYRPSTAFYNRAGSLSHLESAIFNAEGDMAQQLADFAAARENPHTRRPYPLRRYRALFEVLVGGLAGLANRASAHLERYFSGVSLLVGARVRRIGDSRLSFKLRSMTPGYAAAREAMGERGWIRAYSRCEALRRMLLCGFHRGSRVLAYQRRLRKRLKAQRKRHKPLDYEPCERMGRFLYGSAPPPSDGKQPSKSQRKALAAQSIWSDEEDAPVPKPVPRGAGSKRRRSGRQPSLSHHRRRAFFSDDSIEQLLAGAEEVRGQDDAESEEDGDESEGANEIGDSEAESEDEEMRCEEADCDALHSDVSILHAAGLVTVSICESCTRRFCSDCSPGSVCCSTCVADGLDATTAASCDDDGSVAEDLACSVCDGNDRDDAMLLCDGECERGYHFDCIGLNGIPDGDWFCHECRQLRASRTFLQRRSLLQRAQWLQPAQLPFAEGDMVVALYPGSSHTEMQFGIVRRIGFTSSAFSDRLAVRLQWWPIADGSSYPHFAPQPDQLEWEEQQEFWALMRRTERPQTIGGHMRHSDSAQAQIGLWDAEFCTSA